jgi:glycosyltransferase involved in cell wall biosynthesis
MMVDKEKKFITSDEVLNKQNEDLEELEKFEENNGDLDESVEDISYESVTSFNDGSIVSFNYKYLDVDEVIVSLKYRGPQDGSSLTYKPLSVCIIVPTYNESENIVSLLDQIYGVENVSKYNEQSITMNVLVVDDNSPDGTAKIVKDYATHNNNVHLLSRSEKNGLGAAYIAGMKHAMELLNPDIIFEMDGDLSHGPEYIMPMISKVREGADFVIGSRYVKGGQIPDNWGLTRKIISKTANVYAKTVLGIKNVNDCTGGFRAIRTSMLKKIDLTNLKTKGYAFQISLLEEMRRNNAIMKEVPISFKDRTNGKSKMSMHDILEEGLFVLKKSFENNFMPKKSTTKNNDVRENWLERNPNPSPFVNEDAKPFNVDDSYSKENFRNEAW